MYKGSPTVAKSRTFLLKSFEILKSQIKKTGNGYHHKIPLQHISDEYTSMLIRKIDITNLWSNSMKVTNKISAPRMGLKPIINHSVCNDQTDI